MRIAFRALAHIINYLTETEHRDVHSLIPILIRAAYVRLPASLIFAAMTMTASPVQLLVPTQYTNVSAAYAAALFGKTNFIDIGPGLYLEENTLFDANKSVLFRRQAGSVILAPRVPPGNDSSSGALPLSGATASAFAYNYSARHEAGEPDHFGTTNFSRSMWWSWTAPAVGQAIFAVESREFRPLLDVYSAGINGPLPLSGGLVLWQFDTEISVLVEEGATYLIRLAADAAGYGGAELHVVVPAPPPNDARTNAIQLSGHRARVAGNTYAAGPEIGEPRHADVGARRAVWYVWTAPVDTGQANHPLTATTAGSDFDTVLAVYTTNSVGGLELAIENDNVTLTERYSRVTFIPQSGTTYFFAVDGANPMQGGPVRRSFVGNYSLRLDYSWLNLTNRSLGFDAPSSLNGALRMTNEFIVGHYGFAPAGPLRVRIVGRATNSVSGIHLLSAAAESNLLTFPITLSGSGPGGLGFVSTNFVRPAPFMVGNDDRQCFWGVFAILDEQNGTNWFHVDDDFVGFGVIPPGGDSGLHFGIGRAFRPLAATETEVPEITTVVGPPFATDSSTAEIVVATIVAVYRNGQSVDEERSVTPVEWLSDANFPITTDGPSGLLTVSNVQGSTNIVIRATAKIGGLWYRPMLSLPIYKRPVLTAAKVPPGSMMLTLFTEPQRRYRIESSGSLNGTNTLWQTVTTNSFTATNGTYSFSLSTDETNRVFRAVLLP